MTLRLPRVSDKVLSRAFNQIEDLARRTVVQGQVLDSIILRSPNGTKWELTVDNAGNLTTTSLP